jgi:hypothetical protein
MDKVGCQILHGFPSCRHNSHHGLFTIMDNPQLQPFQTWNSASRSAIASRRPKSPRHHLWLSQHCQAAGTELWGTPVLVMWPATWKSSVRKFVDGKTPIQDTFLHGMLVGKVCRRYPTIRCLNREPDLVVQDDLNRLNYHPHASRRIGPSWESHQSRRWSHRCFATCRTKRSQLQKAFGYKLHLAPPTR